MLKSVFLGLIRIHILYHACEEPIYGTGIMEELGRHGYELRPGTLYPILHGMEKEGFLVSYEETVSGKVRKYCTSTPSGRRALEEARKKIEELVSEVLER